MVIYAMLGPGLTFLVPKTFVKMELLFSKSLVDGIVQHPGELHTISFRLAVGQLRFKLFNHFLEMNPAIFTRKIFTIIYYRFSQHFWIATTV